MENGERREKEKGREGGKRKVVGWRRKERGENTPFSPAHHREGERARMGLTSFPVATIRMDAWVQKRTRGTRREAASIKQASGRAREHRVQCSKDFRPSR